MFRLDEALRVYLYREPIDFRLNINCLAMLVENHHRMTTDSCRSGVQPPYLRGGWIHGPSHKL